MADNKIIFEVVATAKGVKVVQQQADKLATSTDKADKSTKKLDKTQQKNYGRQKQGVIQTANGTKNFSKLAQTINGGGGTSLVGAYATLAANVFAATAAFSALSRAAEFKALEEGLSILGSQSGVTLSVLSQGLRDVTGGALSMEQAMRGAALGASGGFGGPELEGLAKIAKGASITLGRDMADAFDRLTRGAIKLEPEILDELGIMVRLDDATEVYAASLNKTAGELTQLERRQAFMNAILVQGEAKFGSIADQVDSTPYQKLGATFSDLTKNIFVFVNEILGLNVVVSFLAENTGVLFGVMLAFGSTIAGQMLPGLAQMAGNAANAANEARILADSLTDISATEVEAAKEAFLGFGGGGNFKKAQKAIQKGGDATAEYGKALTSLKKSETMRIANLKKYSGEELKMKLAELQAIQAKKLATEELIAAEAGLAASQTKATSAGIAANLAANQADEVAALTAGEVGLSAAIGNQVGNLKEYYKEMDKMRGKTNLLTKANKALGLMFGTLLLSLKSFGLVIMKNLPLIAGFLLAVGVAVAAYKFFTKKNEKEQALFDQTEKLNDILGEMNKKVEQYNILREAAMPGAIKQVKINENLENTIKEINDALKLQIKLRRELGNIDRDDIGTTTFGMGDKRSFASFNDQFTTGNKKGNSSEDVIGTEFENIFSSEVFAAQLDGATDVRQAYKNMFDVTGTPEYKAFDAAMLNPEYRKFLEAELNFTDILNLPDGSPIKDYLPVLGRMAKAVQKVENAFKGSGTAVKDLSSELANTEKVGSALLTKMFKKSQFTDTLTSFSKLKKGLDDINTTAEKTGKDGGNAMGIALTGAGANLTRFLSSNTKEMLTEVKLIEDKILKLGETDPGQKALLEQDLSNIQDNLGTQGPAELAEAFTMLKAMNDEELTRKSRLKQTATVQKTLTKLKIEGAKGSAAMLAMEERQLSIKKESMTSELEILALTNDVFDKTKSREEIIVSLQQKAALYEKNEEKIAEYAEITLMLQKEKNRALEEALAMANKQEKMDLADEKRELAGIKRMEKILKIQNERSKLSNEKSSSSAGRGGEESLVDRVQRQNDTDTKALGLIQAKLDAENEIFRLNMIIQKGQIDILDQNGAFADDIAKDPDFVTNLKAQIQTSIEGTGDVLGEEMVLGAEKLGSAIRKEFDEIFGGDGPLMEGIEAQLAAAMRTTEIGNDKAATSQDKMNANLAITKKNLKDMADATDEMFGEDGALISAMYNLGSVFASTALDIGSAFADIDKAVDGSEINDTQGFLLKTSAVAGAIGAMLGAAQQVVAADAKTRTKLIDQAIEKEKKLDGKSKESLNRIKTMEAKKEQIERKAFETRKKMQLAQAVMSTAQGVSNALASGFPPFNFIMAGMVAAMGMAQIAIIRKQQFTGGGSSDVPKPTSINIGGSRNNKVDVSKGASSGETAFLRGGQGVGSNANNFTPGGAMGRKGYATGGMLVGERGPEVVTKDEIIPNYALGGEQSMNLTFNVNALDGQSVQEFLTNNQGAVVGAIRDAANSYGQDFLPDVNVGYGGDG